MNKVQEKFSLFSSFSVLYTKSSNCELQDKDNIVRNLLVQPVTIVSYFIIRNLQSHLETGGA